MGKGPETELLTLALWGRGAPRQDEGDPQINFKREITAIAVIKSNSSSWFPRQCAKQRNKRYIWKPKESAATLQDVFQDFSLFSCAGLDVCLHSFTPLCPFQSTSLAKLCTVKAGPYCIYQWFSTHKTVAFSAALCVPPSRCPECCGTSWRCWMS